MHGLAVHPGDTGWFLIGGAALALTDRCAEARAD
jgi:hypothetical protein